MHAHKHVLIQLNKNDTDALFVVIPLSSLWQNHTTEFPGHGPARLPWVQKFDAVAGLWLFTKLFQYRVTLLPRSLEPWREQGSGRLGFVVCKTRR